MSRLTMGRHLFFGLMCALLCASSAWAQQVKLEEIHPDMDKAALARGADLLMNTCHGCHTLKYVKYRDLIRLGLDKQKVDDWRGDQPMDAALQSQTPESDAIQSFGKAPPDLSLMVRARDGGANYVYSYLLGYYTTPDGTTANHIFPETKMPDPLNISNATDAAQRSQIQHNAHDIVSFLAWASDPHQAERTRLGYYVIAYLIVLTVLLFFVKNLIWSRLSRSDA